MELTLTAGESNGQKAFVDTTRINQNKWGPHLVHSDWSALCQTLLDGAEQEDLVTKDCSTRLQIRWTSRRSENVQACSGNLVRRKARQDLFRRRPERTS